MMNSYRRKVKAAAQEKSGEPIYNGSIEHAEILTENLFANAQDHVRILSGELNPRVFGSDDVMEQVRLFLADPDHKLQILVEDFSTEEMNRHPLFKECNPAENNLVELKIVPKAVQEKYDFHLLVADTDSYRFEQDRTKTVAIAAFGDQSGAENLIGLFDELWNKGELLVN